MLRRPLVLATALALVGFVVHHSSGASSPRNGRIAYDHIGGSGPSSQIYTISATGAHVRHLTAKVGVSSFSPSYAPNGKRIVFVRGYRQNDLWTMRADGSDKRRLTWTKQLEESHPAWSPDGKEIVFNIDTEYPSTKHGICVLGSDGRGRRRLTNGSDSNPSWSPDGTRIAFDRDDDPTRTSGIFVVPADGGVPTRLSSAPQPDGASDWRPAWSPDGSLILFGSDRLAPNTFRSDLWTMNPHGSDVRQVTNSPGLHEHDAVWSPDGRWIAYSAVGANIGTTYQLYVSRADGSSRRIITHACGDCEIVNRELSWQPLPG